MAKWSLQLLGGFALKCNGEAVDLPNRKDRLLLGFLGLQFGRPVSRDKLAGLLWADRAEEQARGSLRQSLAALRSTFGEDAEAMLLAARDSITLKNTHLDIDVANFERTASDASAVATYAGPLLDGFDPPGPEYGEWLLPERQRLEDLAASVVERIAAMENNRQDLASAILLGRQLLRRDRLREPVYRALMRLLARDNQRIEALKLFSQCEAVLSEELGVKPAEQTKKIYYEILDDAPTVPQEFVQAALPPAGERPSIAIMPFQNISRESELDILCDGLAEDITSGLGRFKLFSVIDRFSSAEIAKSTSDAQEIGKRLGVDLVVQGSLQRQQDCLRMTVKLIDTATRAQKWSGQFNLKPADILSAPGKIMAAVLPSINSQVESSLLERSRRKPALAAYEHLLVGIRHLRGYEPDDNQLAIEHFDKALAADPDFALAMAYRGFADIVSQGYNDTPPDILEAALALIRRASNLDPDEPRIWWLMGVGVSYTGDFAAEEQCYRRSVALNPSDANALAALASVTVARGEHELGLSMYREAFRLNPYHPEWYWVDFGNALYISEKYEEALESFSHRRNPHLWVLTRIAACYAQLGRMDEARAVVDKVMKLYPGFRLSQQREAGYALDDVARFRVGMVKAGLPE